MNSLVELQVVFTSENIRSHLNRRLSTKIQFNFEQSIDPSQHLKIVEL